MLLANDKTLQELEDREISIIDCISNKAVLVMGSAEERYAMINWRRADGLPPASRFADRKYWSDLRNY